MGKFSGKIVIAAACALALALSGCAGKTGEAGSAAGKKNPFVGDANQTFYMVTFVSGFPYWKNAYKGFKDAAAAYGVKTVYGGTTEYDINAAVTALDQIIAKKPAGIAVSCMDAEAYAPSINKAIDAGIPVITFDSDSPASKRICHIGTLNFQAGATAARYIGKQLDGKGRIALATTISQSNIRERNEGFKETIKKEFPGIAIVQVVDGGTDQVAAATAVANLLKNHPDVQYIFCTQVAISVGAQQAIEEAGKTGKIRIVAFDTDTVILDAIKAGKVDASVSQAPWCMGFWSMNYLYFIKNNLIPIEDWQKKHYPAIPVTADGGSIIVDKSNADSFYSPEK